MTVVEAVDSLVAMILATLVEDRAAVDRAFPAIPMIQTSATAVWNAATGQLDSLVNCMMNNIVVEAPILLVEAMDPMAMAADSESVIVVPDSNLLAVGSGFQTSRQNSFRFLYPNLSLLKHFRLLKQIKKPDVLEQSTNSTHFVEAKRAFFRKYQTPKWLWLITKTESFSINL